MVKMEKIEGMFLTGEYVAQLIEEHDTVHVTFMEEPHKEKNEQFGTQSYHVKVKLAETGEEKTWNMNGRTSNFLAAKFGGDTQDFPEKSIEIVAVRLAMNGKFNWTVYPKEMVGE